MQCFTKFKDIFSSVFFPGKCFNLQFIVFIIILHCIVTKINAFFLIMLVCFFWTIFLLRKVLVLGI